MNTHRIQAENALLRQLHSEWSFINRGLFYSRMRPPVFELGHGVEQLGVWVPSTRTIRLSRRLLFQRSWGEVIEVLKHEMAHQFVTEALRVRHEPPHGPTFRSVCARLGIDGAVHGVSSSTTEEPRTVRRIRRLLALADSPNQHEAQAAMNAAQKLMLKHNIAVSSGHQAARYGFRQLGQPKKTRQAWEKVLGGILTEFFFVRGVWVWAYDPVQMKTGRVLEVVGTTDNLDIAEWVHAFLTDTAARLWEAHKRAQGITGNRHRRRFLSGVMVGFSDKLDQQAQANHEQGLVWVGDGNLDDYYQRRHPRVTTSRASTMRVDGAWEAGRAAGERIVLNKPVRQDAANRRRTLKGPSR